MEPRLLREHVFDAFKAADAPVALGEARRKAFVDDAAPLKLSELDMDSLARMEFCIAIEIALGVTLLPAQLEKIETTDEIVRLINAALT
jgi:acyl carrier protein